MITRRSFIKQVALGLAAMSMGGMQMGCTRPVKGKLTFGVISDVHEELQADAKDRLKKFLADADGRSLDFIIQLGDMSHGNKAQEMMDIWNTYAGPRYSVLETMIWIMPTRKRLSVSSRWKVRIIRLMPVPSIVWHWT